MTSNRMTRAELIRWLGDTIRTETAKPFDEIDYDLVEECGCLLDELMGKSAALSEKEIAERLAKILPESGSAVRKKIKYRKLWKIAVAAAVVLCMAVTVMAVPTWRQAILTALNLNAGDSVDVNGITYVRAGVEKHYNALNDVLENEELDFLPPNIQTSTPRLERIIYSDEIDIVYLRFDDVTISYEIWLGNTDISPYVANATEYHFNGYTTNVVILKTADICTYYSYTIIENDIHNIVSDSLDTIEMLINSIS
ncbi:MAG: hypothetical protein IJ325_13350 [Clostridia bacterium]|nr:hypothetical protein [Clostridia bacterium]